MEVGRKQQVLRFGVGLNKLVATARFVWPVYGR